MQPFNLLAEKVKYLLSHQASPNVDAEYLKEIEKARRDLRAMIYRKKFVHAPIFLRLALYDAAKTGGPDGSIRFWKELNHYEHRDLKAAIELCEFVKGRYPKITYADLYQLAGMAALDITRGPSIDFVPGRKDSNGTQEEWRLPDAGEDASYLRHVFYRMGLTDKDIVALLGGLTLGRVRMDISKYFEHLSEDSPVFFDSSYYEELLEEDSVMVKNALDKALLEDPQFCHYVKAYAEDFEMLLEDYAASHKKLSELGFTTASTVLKSSRTTSAIRILEVAIVAVVVILSFIKVVSF